MLNAICQSTSHPVCVHFMVDNPKDHVEACANMKLDYFVFHVEAERIPFRLIQKIRELGMRPGIAVNPITSVKKIEELLPFVDVVTLMAVEPGFSGQTFLDLTYRKLCELKKMRKDNNFCIEIDGGITMGNSATCAAHGADVLVGGAFTLFRGEGTIESNFNKMNELLKQEE